MLCFTLIDFFFFVDFIIFDFILYSSSSFIHETNNNIFLKKWVAIRTSHDDDRWWWWNWWNDKFFFTFGVFSFISSNHLPNSVFSLFITTNNNRRDNIMVLLRLSVATILSSSSSLSKTALACNNGLPYKLITRRSLHNRCRSSSSRRFVTTTNRILGIRGGSISDGSSDIAQEQERNFSSETKFVKLSDPAPGSREYHHLMMNALWGNKAK